MVCVCLMLLVCVITEEHEIESKLTYFTITSSLRKVSSVLSSVTVRLIISLCFLYVCIIPHSSLHPTQFLPNGADERCSSWRDNPMQSVKFCC
jgi:hypothetical protein